MWLFLVKEKPCSINKSDANVVTASSRQKLPAQMTILIVEGLTAGFISSITLAYNCLLIWSWVLSLSCLTILNDFIELFNIYLSSFS